MQIIHTYDYSIISITDVKVCDVYDFTRKNNNINNNLLHLRFYFFS